MMPIVYALKHHFIPQTEYQKKQAGYDQKKQAGYARLQLRFSKRRAVLKGVEKSIRQNSEWERCGEGADVRM